MFLKYPLLKKFGSFESQASYCPVTLNNHVTSARTTTTIPKLLTLLLCILFQYMLKIRKHWTGETTDPAPKRSENLSTALPMSCATLEKPGETLPTTYTG